MKANLEEIDNRALLELLERQAQESKEYDLEIEQLAEEAQTAEAQLQAALDSGATDNELLKQKELAEQKLAELKEKLNKKHVLFGELLQYARILMDQDDLIVQNDADRLCLQKELDVGRIELAKKTKLAEEL